MSESRDLDARLKGLSPAQRALLERRLLERRSNASGGRVPRRRDSGPAPLSHSQELLWLVDQLGSGGFAYNSPSAYRVSGPLDVEALQRALAVVVDRHEVLRTTYELRDGIPVQVVSAQSSVALELVDLAEFPEEQREGELQRFLKEESERPFDLGQGPIIRPSLIRVAPDDHVLFVVSHHIAIDGWSKDILFGELASLYDAFSRGLPSPLEPVRLQYADYAVWHRNWLDQGVLAQQLDYWKDQLAGAPSRLELPTDRPRPAAQSYAGGHQSLLLDPAALEALSRVGRKHDATLFMTLVGAFATLLHRYSGQDDIVIGTPFLGRNRAELEQVVGYFTNTVALRMDLSGDPSFREVMSRARETTLGAFANGDVPYERIIRDLHPERDLSQTPVFQVLMVLQNPASSAQRPAFDPAGLTTVEVRHERDWAKFDLSLGMRERPQGLNTAWEYSSELFDAETVERTMWHFKTLLEEIVRDPSQRISRLRMLTHAEQQQVVITWNQGRAEESRESLHALVEAQVARTPSGVAVEAEGTSLTYAELDARANQLAHRLRRLGIGRDEAVAIATERSFDFVVGLLGILKAGGACMPLDPAYPLERLSFMLEDAGVKVLVAHEAIAQKLSVRTTVLLDQDWHDVATESRNRPEPRSDPDDLAYVIYTSGSTGTPRGVLLPHRGLANHANGAIDLYGFDSTDRVLQFSSASFDISIEEIFPTLAVGATVVLRPLELPLVGRPFLEWIEQQRITVLDLPTAFWHAWVSDLAELGATVPDCVRLVIVGGEKASAAVYRTWLRVGGGSARFVNTYGPTEASVIASAYEPGRGETPDDLPIGRPTPNTKLYVLDRNLQPVPVGIWGELHIGGAGVARGYQGRSELSGERFIPDPFSGRAEARMYKTGDVVRWLPDANLQFGGRTDGQVKIRGFRVEPAEIEAALERHPAVHAALVLARQEDTRDARLVAYVQRDESSQALDPADLRRYLAEHLPAFMIPASFVVVDAFPLTANGKLDHAALPEPAPEPAAERDEEQSSTERVVARIWRDVLDVDGFGLDENFFTLGGHSLLAAQVVARVRDGLSVDLTMRTLFEAPTVREFARVVDSASADSTDQGPRLGRVDRSRYRRNAQTETVDV